MNLYGEYSGVKVNLIPQNIKCAWRLTKMA